MADFFTEAGFADEAEWNRLCAAPDLSSKKARDAFVNWRDNDGTKAGLIALFPELAPPTPGSADMFDADEETIACFCGD